MDGILDRCAQNHYTFGTVCAARVFSEVCVLLELVRAGGWLMVPILLCSVIAMAIVAERFWTLQRRRVTPGNLVVQVWQWAKSGKLDEERVRALRKSSPLGRILAAGLVNRSNSRELMKENIEDVGRHVIHDLDRYLNTLGTIASITPLLGLLTILSDEILGVALGRCLYGPGVDPVRADTDQSPAPAGAEGDHLIKRIQQKIPFFGFD